MTESTQHPKRSAREVIPGTSHEAAAESNPKRDRDRPAAASGEEAAEFNLSGLQHAQATQAAFAQEQIGVALTDLGGKIQRANRALATLLLYSQAELNGKVLQSLTRPAGRSQNLLPEAESLREDRRVSPALTFLARKSGDAIACLVESHAIHDDTGKITHFLVFVADARSARDTEERKRFESEIYRAQALQTLGLLAGGVAHDFNNALEVIIGFASLARVRLSHADPLHEPLKIIEESAKGAAGLVRQLLDVSRDSSDEEELIETGPLVSTAVSIITRTFDRKIRIAHKADHELPLVRGIRSRLEQAILNLCLNARDAMQEGGTLTLEASFQTLGKSDPRLPASNIPGDYVRISVRDSGEGMPAEVMERIFVPLFSTKGPGRGFGMGLAMVDRIVREAQGFISVTSKPGQGSEFSVYLPAVSSEAPVGARHESMRAVSGRGEVLVVDDEPRVLEFLEKGLTRLGYEVLTAESGNRACEIYSSKSSEINCVLLDLIMPGMSGLEAYARLRNINPGVRVILSSGYSSGSIRREAVEAGSPEFLEKPYTLEELSQALQKIQQN